MVLAVLMAGATCVWAAPLATAAPARSITLSPTTGPSEAEVTITGSGFAPDGPISLKFDRAEYPPADIVTPGSTDGTGQFTAVVRIPAGTANGRHKLTALDPTSKKATQTFTVVNEYIVLGVTSGVRGSTVPITGSGFPPNSAFTITFDNAPAVVVTGFTTDAAGQLTTVTVVPSAAPSGTVTVTVTAGTVSASAPFVVLDAG